MNPLLTLIAEDQQLITYRPKLNKITGSVTATILLQQILFHWKGKKGIPFYKFKEPCSHERYKEGDSWEEEIGFSRKEFDTAIKKIGYKIGKNKNFKEKKKQEAFVWFRTDSQRVTWYEVNEKALEKALNGIYLVTTEWGDSYRPNGALVSNDRMGRYNNTENTTENTTETTCTAGNVEQDSFVEKTQHVEQDVNCNPCTAVCNSSVNQCSVSLEKEVVESFAGGSVFEILQRRQPGFKKHDKTVGDINKFKDRLYRKKRQYSSAEYTEALKIYNAMPDDNQHKINMTDYINHESQKWDFSKTNNKDVVVARFILEYIFWHPIYQHFQVIKRNNELDVDIANYKKRHKKLKKDTIPDDIKEEDMEKTWGEMATA
jgi:hypothetical protein